MLRATADLEARISEMHGSQTVGTFETQHDFIPFPDPWSRSETRRKSLSPGLAGSYRKSHRFCGPQGSQW